jgi:hypothetical protein
MKIKYKRTFVLILALITVLSISAQRKRNYIYLLDCSESVFKTYNNSSDIWGTEMKYLRNAIQQNTDLSNSYIIPFHKKTLTTIRKGSLFTGSDITIYSPINHYSWDTVEKCLTEIANKKHKSANICDALITSIDLMNWHQDNYVVLFASSPNNVKNLSAFSKVLNDRLLKFPYAYFFYVAMTEESVTEEIKETLTHHNRMYLIDARKKLPLFACLNERDTIFANTRNLDRIIKIGCSIEGEHKAEIISDHPDFDVSIENNTIKDGIIPVRIAQKKDVNTNDEKAFENFNINSSIQIDGVDVINPNISFCLTNKISRSLDTYDDEVFIGNAIHYDKFLFKDARTDTLVFDFKHVFNEIAKRNRANVDFVIFAADRKDDFQILHNGKLVKPIRMNVNDSLHNNVISFAPIRLSANDSLHNNIISFVFNPYAKNGDRYIAISAISTHKLDDINCGVGKNFTLMLRAHYEIEMNPWEKVVTIFLGIVLFVFLVYVRMNIPLLGAKLPRFGKH